jgi:hypothetical protein
VRGISRLEGYPIAELQLLVIDPIEYLLMFLGKEFNLGQVFSPPCWHQHERVHGNSSQVQRKVQQAVQMRRIHLGDGAIYLHLYSSAARLFYTRHRSLKSANFPAKLVLQFGNGKVNAHPDSRYWHLLHRGSHLARDERAVGTDHHAKTTLCGMFADLEYV